MENTIKDKKQFSIYLDENDYNELLQMAKKDDRPLVSYVRNILKKHIKETNK